MHYRECLQRAFSRGDGRLIEVMPDWRFRTVNLWLVHLGNRFTPRSVRVFKEFAAQMAPKIFPELPT
jgi:hypothetical protein